MTCLKLGNIVRVHAAKRGYVGKDVDQSGYCLVLTIRKVSIHPVGDVKLKILETKNYKKIIKQVRQPVSVDCYS